MRTCSRLSGWIVGLGMLALMGYGALCAAELSQTPMPGLPALDGPIFAIVQHGDRIYIGGGFKHVGGVARDYLAALDADTLQLDMAWDPYMKDNVYGIAVAGNYVYACGYFDQVNITYNGPIQTGTPRTRVAAFRLADGVNDGAVDAWNPVLSQAPGNTLQFWVYGIAATADKVYIAGRFDMANGVSRKRLVAVGAAGTPQAGQVDMAWNPAWPFGDQDWPQNVTLAGGKVYVGCTVDQAASPATAQPALFALEPANGSSTGQQDPAWHPLFLQPASEQTIRIWKPLAHGTNLYVPGFFEKVNGVTRRGLAALSLADGVHSAAVDPVWNPNIPVSKNDLVVPHPWQAPDCLAVVNNQLIVGGMFPTVNGNVARTNLAAFGLADGVNTGALNPAWDPTFSPSLFLVDSLGTFNGGLLMAGDFNAAVIGGQHQSSLVAFGGVVPVELSSFSLE